MIELDKRNTLLKPTLDSSGREWPVARSETLDFESELEIAQVRILSMTASDTLHSETKKLKKPNKDRSALDEKERTDYISKIKQISRMNSNKRSSRETTPVFWFLMGPIPAAHYTPKLWDNLLAPKLGTLAYFRSERDHARALIRKFDEVLPLLLCYPPPQQLFPCAC
ncbi:hypothetical protein J6590_024161 [Homalodisca vitripennis]|nr:hypothetical protein J6590_024161 [Homalodisca vitripennis]